MSANVENVGSKSSNAIVHQPIVREKSPIPLEILVRILSFLPPAEIARCCRVCSYFNEACSDNSLWRSLIISQFGKQVIIEHETLVSEGKQSWKEVYVNNPSGVLSTYFNRISEERYRDPQFIIRNNPQISQFRSHAKVQPTVTMPKPFCLHHDSKFYISNCSDIVVKKKDTLSILKGKEDTLLMDLSIDGNFLYAFRDDGFICQWNHQTKEFVREIETTFTEYSETLKLICGSSFDKNLRHSFLAQDGYLIIGYGDDRSSTFKVIQTKDSEIYTFGETASADPERMFIREKKLYMMRHNEISIWNLESRKQELLIKINVDSNGPINDITVDNNRLYAHTDKLLYTIDLQNGSEIKKIAFPAECCPEGASAVLGNLFLGNHSGGISIFDLETGTKVGRVENILDSSGDINLEAFKQVILMHQRQLAHLGDEKERTE